MVRSSEQQNLPSSSSSSLPELDPEEDREIKDARARLIRALEAYKGEHPPTGIDPAELTVPVEISRGEHATIYKGVRAGNPVAIKKLNIPLTDSDMVTA